VLVDCDVHEMLKSERDLLPYLKGAEFVSAIRDRDWHMEVRFPFGKAQPTVGGLDRADAKPADGGPGGSDLELMRRQVLDEEGAAYAVLTGLFYPSVMNAWPDFACALASAYNDWVVDNWLEQDDRLLGSVHVAAQRPAEAAREIDRMGAHPQIKQVMLPLCQHLYGDPHFHEIFAAAERQGLVIAMHNCGATLTTHGYFNYFIEWHTAICQSWMSQIISMISNGVFERFPTLKAVMAESGFTWVAHLMSRFDQQWRELRREVPWVTRAPSDYIRERIRFTTQPVEEMPVERVLQLIDWMESDELLVYSSDYPHWDYDAPQEAVRGLPEGLQRKILFDNAAALYGIKAPEPQLSPA
jgi:uncharacterized protein